MAKNERDLKLEDERADADLSRLYELEKETLRRESFDGKGGPNHQHLLVAAAVEQVLGGEHNEDMLAR